MGPLGLLWSLCAYSPHWHYWPFRPLALLVPLGLLALLLPSGPFIPWDLQSEALWNLFQTREQTNLCSKTLASETSTLLHLLPRIHQKRVPKESQKGSQNGPKMTLWALFSFLLILLLPSSRNTAIYCILEEPASRNIIIYYTSATSKILFFSPGAAKGSQNGP